MGRNKKKIEPKRVFTPEELSTGLTIAHQEYFRSIVALASLDPNMEELTYIRVPVETPNGGTYLVSVLHIDGPKLNLKALAAAADAQVADAAKK